MLWPQDHFVEVTCLPVHHSNPLNIFSASDAAWIFESSSITAGLRFGRCGIFRDFQERLCWREGREERRCSSGSQGHLSQPAVRLMWHCVSGLSVLHSRNRCKLGGWWMLALMSLTDPLLDSDSSSETMLKQGHRISELTKEKNVSPKLLKIIEKDPAIQSHETSSEWWGSKELNQHWEKRNNYSCRSKTNGFAIYLIIQEQQHLVQKSDNSLTVIKQ